MAGIRQAQIDSIQTPPDALNEQTHRVWPHIIERGPLLPAYGSRRRLSWQRYYDRYDTNTVWMGASAAMGKKIAATPYELRGPKGEDIRHWEALYRNADFGRGITSLTKKLTRDLFRFDIGAWLEIAGPGHPLLPMTGAPTGLTVLDPMHIWPTGDPIYPAFYENEGELHLLHYDRVVQFVDAPDSDENFPGWGLSALSRAISFIHQMMLMNRYVNEQLDDKPSSGIIVANNLQEETFRAAIAKMKRGLDADEPDVLGRTIVVFADWVENKASLEMLAMATPPEKFDYEKYLNINVDAVALAMGIDRQELWQLTGTGMGTGAQSDVLHAKSQGRTYSDILAMFTRSFNSLMPEALEFEYKYRDADEDAAQAQTRQTNFTAVMGASSVLSTDEQRRLLALLDSSAQDVLTDPDGEMISLDDADVRPDDADTIIDDGTALTDGQKPEEKPKEDADTLSRTSSLARFRLTKDFAVTAAHFAQVFVNVLSEGMDDEINRRRFGIVLRNELRKAGTSAFKDGLEKAGVNRENFTNENYNTVLAIAAEESQHVTSLSEKLFYGGGVSEDEMFTRAEMWGHKSLRRFLHAGIESGGRNAAFGWRLGQTEEHCRSCIAASKKVALFRTWRKHNIEPGSERLFCGGYNCDCEFFRTDQKTTGGLSRIPLQ